MHGVYCLIEVTRTHDVGMIKDETNFVAQRRASPLEVHGPYFFERRSQRRVLRVLFWR